MPAVKNEQMGNETRL